MKFSNLVITLFILITSIVASASSDQCHFEANIFQCGSGFVANNCITAGGHYGVSGCTCCPKKASIAFMSFIPPMNSTVFIDGICTITTSTEITSIPFHSETTEKQALGFNGASGTRYRLAIANNSETSFAKTRLLQVSIDRDDDVKNPPQLCPTEPADEEIQCERKNNSLYPPLLQFAAFDNVDGVAISDPYSDAYEKSLLPSDLVIGGFAKFEAAQKVDETQVRCDLTVSQ